MKRYPIGIQDFEKLREENYLYVDKTRQTFELANSGSYFFLSRPRRFGKSLLLSTLKYFFLGRRELFEGLWVDREATYDWAEHPVLHFSFSEIDYQQLGLYEALLGAVNEAADSYGIALTEQTLALRFRELIHTLGAGAQKVVLLIDEYDKPLTDYFEDLPQAEANRKTLKNFFSILKNADAYLRLFLITGVSKFSKVSLFSDLNNLEDLTLSPYAATLTGYTQAELEAYFSEEIDQIAQQTETSRSKTLDRIRLWYNGYQWDIGQAVYNPFSILNWAKSGKIRNYWWETGTPTFLLKALQREFQFELEEVEGGSPLFDSYTLENLDWRSLLFQTGYLTIKHYDEEVELYTLGYPNREVKASMYQYLTATFRHSDYTQSQSIFAQLKRALDAGDMERVIEQVNRLFSTLPYQIFEAKRENFFHALLHLTFQGLGLLTQSEVSTAKGRVDTVVHSKSGIYVMEFKLDDSAEAALQQIEDKGYAQPYRGQGQSVFVVGISFSSETKTVQAWEMREG